jgi:hypothetical protein
MSAVVSERERVCVCLYFMHPNEAILC